MATIELQHLMDEEIPEGRQHLKESYVNLEKVAAYCQENYLKAQDKRHALEETKDFTTRSLASVAYQINTLATNFLHMLDLQATSLGEMESSINHLAQVVNIHKEKVARREIGVLTTNKTTLRPPGMKNGIIFPDQPEQRVKYSRKNIDYTELDNIGHGVQVQAATPQSARAKVRSDSISSRSSTGSNQRQAPTQRPPTPPHSNQGGGGGSMSGKSHYRTPLVAPVAPPTLPSDYQPNYPIGQSPSQRRGSGPYAPLGMVRSNQHHAMPPMGVAQPMTPPTQPPPAPPNSQMPPGINQGPMMPPHSQGSSMMNLPPGQMQPHHHQQQVPPVYSQQQKRPSFSQQISQVSSTDSYVTSVSDQQMMMGDVPDMGRSGNVSPPLPPPPPDHQVIDFNHPPAPLHQQQINFDQYAGQRPSYGQQHHPHLRQPQPYDNNQGDYQSSSSLMTEDHDTPTQYIEKVVAIYDYDADKEDELTFKEDAIIYVIKKNDDGWWEGTMNGMTGLFPGNYVESLI
ncbi:abl interactor 2-like [Tubulanus polymorphus]|uniref:abl interactor 2-like n=1 Tax=Tubulanus polymorphus TaxID=672921 RepID=UPI003DA5ABC3